MANEEELESKRSAVRVWVTYGAAAFLFAGGALMIVAFLYKGFHDEAKDIFLTVLPVSSAIVSYWFAGRSTEKSKSGNAGPNKQN